MSGQSSVAFAYLRCGEDERTVVVCPESVNSERYYSTRYRFHLELRSNQSSHGWFLRFCFGR